jgi:hypothetical protein
VEERREKREESLTRASSKLGIGAYAVVGPDIE